jgi:uncharacterized protein (DUF2141 family)
MRYIRYSLVVIGFIIFAAVSYRCASVGSITGGDKDTIPPKMVSSNPKQYALNFKKNKIELEFNEYLELKDVNKEFNISPPLNKKPKIWLKNRTVMVEYADTLKDSTTYTLNFGNSIKDKNELNPARNFEFVFSTTNYLDSLGVSGRVVNAFDLKPQDGTMMVILHSDLSDSAVFKQIPMFTSRADKDGYFSINNVKPGKYNLYALLDKNLNYKYNQGSDGIAFLDSVIVLDPKTISENKNSKVIFPRDTVKILKDTAKQKIHADSLKIEKQKEKDNIREELFFFTEKERRQYIKSYYRKDKYYFNLVFSNDLKNDSIIVKPVYFSSENWYNREKTERKDSLKFWITDTTLMKSDTFRLSIQYWGTNKANQTVWKNDTLNFRYASETNQPKKKNTQTPGMKINFEVSGAVDLNSKPSITTEYPINKIDISKFQLLQRVDTVEFPAKFEIERDSISLTKIFLDSKWVEQTQYKLTIYPGAFENIYNIPNDTVVTSFTTQKMDYYGKLNISVKGVHSPTIIQLLDKEKEMYQKEISKDGLLVFDYILPKLYTIKIIYDTNKDGRWTTGDLIKKIQPEKVFFYNEDVNVRSNWVMDITLNIE